MTNENTYFLISISTTAVLCLCWIISLFWKTKEINDLHRENRIQQSELAFLRNRLREISYRISDLKNQSEDNYHQRI